MSIPGSEDSSGLLLKLFDGWLWPASGQRAWSRLRAGSGRSSHRKNPFIWTKPADEILDKINRKRKHVSTTGH
jgi:hypothetical protein